MRNFYIDGTSSATYNIFASGENIYNAAERDVESVYVPGRNGNLLIDNGTFKNINIKYPCVMPYGFTGNAQNLRNWLSLNSYGYHKITDDYDTTHFRMGRYKGGIEFAPMYTNQAAATFDLTFDCKPQRFLNSGDEWVSYVSSASNQSYTITNPTQFDSRPVIHVTNVLQGTTLYVNNGEIKFLRDSTLYIDCEAQKAYYSDFSADRDSWIQCDNFPELKPGENSITFRGTIPRLRILPRWWEL